MPATNLPKTRSEAKLLGANQYFTGRKCKHGHIAARCTSNAECMECSRQRGRRIYDSEKAHEYYLSNIDRIKEWSAEWYRLNRERKYNKGKEWEHNNPERARARFTKHSASPQGKLSSRIRSHRRRARVASIPGTHTALDVEKIIAQGSRCFVCGKKFTKSTPPSIEHVIAVTHKLGTNDAGNLAPTHLSCNQSKHASRFNPITGQGILV